MQVGEFGNGVILKVEARQWRALMPRSASGQASHDPSKRRPPRLPVVPLSVHEGWYDHPRSMPSKSRRTFLLPTNLVRSR